ncbi:MAG: hypothetical protein CM15mV148_130 [uncultured marine virus]|nr:MAG: hypothetical protein CM15mV148_130 [uncultured marine virus]
MFLNTAILIHSHKYCDHHCNHHNRATHNHCFKPPMLFPSPQSFSCTKHTGWRTFLVCLKFHLCLSTGSIASFISRHQRLSSHRLRPDVDFVKKCRLPADSGTTHLTPSMVAMIDQMYPRITCAFMSNSIFNNLIITPHLIAVQLALKYPV